MQKDRRFKLHEELCNILGSRNVYFQPPETIKMTYPCVVYQRGSADNLFADNSSYGFSIRYDVTVIDKNPDSDLVDKIVKGFSQCMYDRHYVSENLNHDVFRIYY